MSQENVEIVHRALTAAFVSEPPDAEALREVLDPDCVFVSNWGVEEVEHHGVDEALAVIQQQRPDVLISDLGMPVRDGFDLIRAVRALPVEAGGGVAAHPPGAGQRQRQHGGAEGSRASAVAGLSARPLDAAARLVVEPDRAVLEWVSSRRAAKQLARLGEARQPARPSGHDSCRRRRVADEARS